MPAEPDQRYEAISKDWIARCVWKPLGDLIASLAVRIGVHAHAVTASFVIAGVMGAIVLGSDLKGRYAIAGAILVFHYVLDLADGEVARRSGTTSSFGAWLDAAGHLVVNGALSVALGSSRKRALALACCLVGGPGAYALFLTGKDYAARMNVGPLTVARPSVRGAVLGKIAVYFIENPGIGYLLLITEIIGATALVENIIFVSGAAVATVVVGELTRRRVRA